MVGRFLSRRFYASRKVYPDKTRSAFIGTFVNRAVRAREGIKSSADRRIFTALSSRRWFTPPVVYRSSSSESSEWGWGVSRASRWMYACASARDAVVPPSDGPEYRSEWHSHSLSYSRPHLSLGRRRSCQAVLNPRRRHVIVGRNSRDRCRPLDSGLTSCGGEALGGESRPGRAMTKGGITGDVLEVRMVQRSLI